MTGTNGLIIDVQQASLNTATVQIKTLTINGKQVTMAVFRQLLQEELFNEDGTLKGQVWGHVNYFPKPCEPDHLHVVWQKGAELRRACIFENPCRSVLATHEQRMREAASDLLAFALRNETDGLSQELCVNVTGYQLVRVTLGGIVVDNIHTPYIASEPWERRDRHRALRLTDRPSNTTAAHIEGFLARGHVYRQRVARSYAASYAICANSPHLFIAT